MDEKDTPSTETIEATAASVANTAEAVTNTAASTDAVEATSSSGLIDVDKWLGNGIEFVTLYGIQILIALAIFIIGKWVAKVVTNGVRKVMEKRNVDPALISFAGNLIYSIMLIFVVIAAIDKIGVQTTSFIAVIGAAGLAVGLALQGSLANFASGVLIILFRPFKIGDFIDAGGAVGVVEEISILVTILKTPDNKKIIAPNAAIMGGVITNVTANDTRRVDMVFGVSYTDDLEKVKSILEEIIASDERILKDPAPQVVVAEHGDSSINFKVRPWTATGDYWGVYFDMHMKVKLRFDQEGISIPFPQRDVHLFQESNG